MDRKKSDINPLTDLGDSDFTDDLIDFFEIKKYNKPTEKEPKNVIVKLKFSKSNKGLKL